MSTEKTLRDFVAALIDRLRAGEPGALARLREVVGERSARIVVEPETIIVRFDGDRLVFRDVPEEAVDGSGVTDRRTVLRLLDAHLEVNDAILGGHLEVTGDIAAVAAMGQAIEILIDSSTRVPALQHLARRYRRVVGALPTETERQTLAFPTSITVTPDAQLDLLIRLDLASDEVKS